MTVHATLVSGPIGPDTIDLPGEPAKLRNASQELRDLARQVEQVGQQLQQVNPPEGAHGRTATAMSRGARRTAHVLEADARQLGQLADAIDGAADALADGQGGVDGLRQRWRSARESLRSGVQSAKGGGSPDVGGLMHRVDAEAAEPHQTQFKRQAGLTFLDGAGGGGPQAHAMLVDEAGEAQRAISEYRRDVRGILDELSGLMQKAKNADNDLEARLPRRASDSFAAQGDGEGADGDHDNVSAPGTVQSIGAKLQEAAQALNQGADRLESIRLAIRAGRMLPEDERMGSNEGFKRDWTEHFETLRESLSATRRAADAAAERLRQIDLESAADIRQALRDH